MYNRMFIPALAFSLVCIILTFEFFFIGRPPGRPFVIGRLPGVPFSSDDNRVIRAPAFVKSKWTIPLIVPIIRGDPETEVLHELLIS